MPAADLKFYQDQARELDDLTARISNIARATKVAGVSTLRPMACSG